MLTTLTFALLTLALAITFWKPSHPPRKRDFAAPNATPAPVPFPQPTAPEGESLTPGPATPVEVPAAGPTMPLVRELSDTTLNPIAERIERNRRLRVAEVEIEKHLTSLDVERWHVERNVNVALCTVQFLIIGPPGVVALMVSDARWTLDDVRWITGAASHLRQATGMENVTVTSAIAQAFDTFAPSVWAARDGEQATVVPGPGLVNWLKGLPGGQVAAGDIAALRERSVIDWSRRQPVWLNAAGADDEQ